MSYFYMSPVVDVREIDVSAYDRPQNTAITAMFLRNAYKGPEHKRIKISNIDDLIKYFGQPQEKITVVDGGSTKEIKVNDAIWDWFEASEGNLKYNDTLYCTRLLSPSATFAGSTESTTDYFTLNPHNLSDLEDLEDDELTRDTFSTALLSEKWVSFSSSRGVCGNKIRIAIVDKATYDATIKKTAAEINGTLTGVERTILGVGGQGVDARLTNDKEFLVLVEELPQEILITDEDTEMYWDIVEVFHVSTDEHAVDHLNRNIFVESVVNKNSQYIKFFLSDTAKNTDLTSLGLGMSEFTQFEGGIDADITGMSLVEGVGPINDGDWVVSKWDEMFGNPEEIDTYIFNPPHMEETKFPSSDSTLSSSVYREITKIAEQRKDCFTLVNCNSGVVLKNKGHEVDDLVDWANNDMVDVDGNIFESSFYGMYGNWVEVYDKFNGKFRWIPSKGHISGIMAYNDTTIGPWGAPAGLNRGIITGVKRLAFNPRLEERNRLYINNINPITTFTGQGKVVWGQKTGLRSTSAFNRINVRRAFIAMEKYIASKSKYHLFEFNDRFTWAKMKAMIEPYLEFVKANRGIYDFKVVIDETNNTPERIDRNELWASIFIQPARAVEYAVLNFIATKTGASFEEVAASLTDEGLI